MLISKTSIFLLGDEGQCFFRCLPLTYSSILSRVYSLEATSLTMVKRANESEALSFLLWTSTRYLLFASTAFGLLEDKAYLLHYHGQKNGSNSLWRKQSFQEPSYAVKPLDKLLEYQQWPKGKEKCQVKTGSAFFLYQTQFMHISVTAGNSLYPHTCGEHSC